MLLEAYLWGRPGLIAGASQDALQSSVEWVYCGEMSVSKRVLEERAGHGMLSDSD